MSKIIHNIRFLFRKRLKIPASFIYTPIRDITYRPDFNEISQYNEAINNDKHSLSDNPPAAHPMFYTKINWRITEKLNEYLEKPIDEKILKTIVHQSEHISIYEQLCVDMNLAVKSKLWSIEPHKKGTKMMVRFDYFSGENLLATEYTSGIFFGVKCLGKGICLGEKPESFRIEEQPLREMRISIDKNLPWDYAKKAEIDAPIHTNLKFAHSIGLPGNILQGTCTLGKSVNAIMQMEQLNSFECISSISAKFTGMIVPPDIMTIRILKKTKSTIYFDVLNKKKQAVIKGGQLVIE